MFEGEAAGGFREGPDGLKGHREIFAFVGGEVLAEHPGAELEKVAEREGRAGSPVGK
jgi:hypothetical protein